ncbi:hypothetical protein R3I93_016074 [Phoxinus phoxinus]|uniref:Uncharacterized protein n=1 Tax=Phoxinus phoxinus TaxID=58324 RepID=A0AAN9CLN9_9TELE
MNAEVEAEEHGSHWSDGLPKWLTVAYNASFCGFSKMLTSENSAQTLCGTVTRECKANGYKYLTKVQTTTKILLRDHPVMVLSLIPSLEVHLIRNKRLSSTD